MSGPRIPWVCACGIFNSERREACRVCGRPRPDERERVPLSRMVATGPQPVVEAHDGEEVPGFGRDLEEVIDALRAYLRANPEDVGVERAVGALDQARPYFEEDDTSRDGAALLSGAHLALSARASMGAAELRETVDRLTVLRDEAMRRAVRRRGP